MKSEFRCEIHGLVEPQQVPEKTLHFKSCRLTVLRPVCPLCGRELVREDRQWKELKDLFRRKT